MKFPPLYLRSDVHRQPCADKRHAASGGERDRKSVSDECQYANRHGRARLQMHNKRKLKLHTSCSHVACFHLREGRAAAQRSGKIHFLSRSAQPSPGSKVIMKN